MYIFPKQTTIKLLVIRIQYLFLKYTVVEIHVAGKVKGA